MFYKDQLRRKLGTKIFDILALITGIYCVGNWVGVFTYMKLHSMGMHILYPMAESIWYAFILTGFFGIFSYYAVDIEIFKNLGLFDQEKFTKEIDHDILNARITLKEIRQAIKNGVADSRHFDAYAKKIIFHKMDLVVSGKSG